MLKRKQRWNYFKELKPPDRPDACSHCFPGWRRELPPYYDVYQWDRETPQKRVRMWHSDLGRRASRRWTEAGRHSRQPCHLRGFSEAPVITCPTHICHDSRTRLFLYTQEMLALGGSTPISPYSTWNYMLYFGFFEVSVGSFFWA